VSRNPGILDTDEIFGFIINVPAKKPSSIFNKVRSLSSQRHWYAFRDLPSPAEKQQGLCHFYNLDSNLDQPRSLGIRTQLIYFIRDQMESSDKHLFLVVSPEVAASQSWRLPFPFSSSMRAYHEALDFQITDYSGIDVDEHMDVI
jgi:josephin